MVFEGRPPTASTPAVPRYFERGVGAVSALEEVCKNHRVIIGPAAVHDLVALCEERVREHGSVGGRRYLGFLECLVTVDRMPVRENQEVVLKEFLALPRAQHSVPDCPNAPICLVWCAPSALCRGIRPRPAISRCRCWAPTKSAPESRKRL